jgi:hypothetical protein
MKVIREPEYGYSEVICSRVTALLWAFRIDGWRRRKEAYAQHPPNTKVKVSTHIVLPPGHVPQLQLLTNAQPMPINVSRISSAGCQPGVKCAI